MSYGSLNTYKSTIFVNIIVSCLIAFFFVFLVIRSSDFKEANRITAENGSAQLTEMDDNRISVFNGKWGVYSWQGDIGGIMTSPPDYYSGVLGSNKAGVINHEKKFYKLHLKTDLSEGTIIAFRLTSPRVCNLYIDSKPIMNSSKSEVGFYTVHDPEFDIIVEVTGRVEATGNKAFLLYVGSTQAVIKYNAALLSKNEILIGMLIIMALFFIGMSFSARDAKYMAKLAAICFLIAFIIDSGNYKDLDNRFFSARQLTASNPIDFAYIWYTAFLFLLLFNVTYLNDLYPSRFSKAIRRLAIFGFTVNETILLLTPLDCINYIMDLYVYTGTVTMICTIAIVVVAMVNRIKDAWPNLLMIIIELLVYIHSAITRKAAIESLNGSFYYLVYLLVLVQLMIQTGRMKIIFESKTLAELSLLHAQIKPHFMHNVINTIISISRTDVDKAREILYDFSSYLRNSLSVISSKQRTELSNEIDLLRHYLKIEKLRFEGRIDFEINVPDDLHYLVPPFVIQPIVENAINHGILQKLEGGRVELTITEEKKDLVFTVKDNGVGLTEKQIHDILRFQKEGSIGLSNIQRRLKMMYNKSLVIKSAYGIGTEVSWRIPKNEKRGIFR